MGGTVAIGATVSTGAVFDLTVKPRVPCFGMWSSGTGIKSVGGVFAGGGVIAERCPCAE